MRRREFIVLLGGAAVAWPLAARGQQAEKVHRIAVVHPTVAVAAMRESGDDPRYSALFKELRRLGYVEGKNLVVERYSAGGRPERYNELAYDVVRAKPDLIVASSNTLALSLQAATDTIPIVGIMADPIAFGNARSLTRPGGNFTGISVGRTRDLGEASTNLAGTGSDGSQGGVARFAGSVESRGGKHRTRGRREGGHFAAWASARKPHPAGRISARARGDGRGAFGWAHRQ
jgi:hypothetical protein